MLKKQLINKFGADYIAILSQKMRVEPKMLKEMLNGKIPMDGYIKHQLHSLMGIYLFQLEKLLGYEIAK